MTTNPNGTPSDPARAPTCVELLRRRSAQQPDQLAYRFLPEAEADSAVTLTYAELDRKARAVAALLQSTHAEGERALLLYPAGPDYVAAFFGCLYAGVVAVPAYPPRNNRHLPRLQAIVADAGARFALTTTALLSQADATFARAEGLDSVRWLATDELPRGLEDEWREPSVSAEGLAFLQYTSGSTSAPKGVMVSHANLLHNSALLARAFAYDRSTVCVTWLPLYHDMGLIGGLLQPLYGGFPNTLMSPLSFLRNPFGWLKAVSDNKATLSGGPDFAYDLCARKVTNAQRESLDLTSWSIAFTGAEPIRAETLERFAAAFAPCGFRREAFFPCYGLAEATLFVSGGPKASGASAERLRRSGLARNEVSLAASDEGEGVQRIVGCGAVAPEQRLLLVEPESGTECAPGRVGEIWLASPSVAGGYWNRPEETEETFGARLSNTNEGPYLRTGDLGYLRGDELFITGRIKDLIIIRGRNLYPQDVELTAERGHALLRANGAAAFTVEVEGEERLVVVQEAEHRRQQDAEAVTEAVRRAVVEEFEVRPHAVVLVRPNSIPRTSSGKIRRAACRAKFLEGTLDVIARSADADAPHAMPREVVSRELILSAAPDQRRGLLEKYLRARVARALGTEAASLDWSRPLSGLGLDSLAAVELQSGAESDLGVVLPMASFLRSPNVAELATRLLELLSGPTPARPASAAQDDGDTQPLSSGEKGLWFLHRLAPHSAAYNIARAARVRSPLDPATLRAAFSALVERHDALRTTFHTLEGRPVRRVREAAELCFVEHDAGAWGGPAVGAYLNEEAARPFDLERGPLLRVHLLKLSEDEHVLLLVAHHIAVDFWSLALLTRELGELYSAACAGTKAALPALSLDYATYARRQAEALSGKEATRDRDYWLEQLKGELPVLNLPADRPRPAVQTHRGASRSFRVDAEQTRLLKSFASSRGATLYVLLLAAYFVLLRRYTGQRDIVVGSPTAGRSRAELTNVVGYFVNAVALRAELSSDPRFVELLEEVRQTVLDAFEHQDYPFAEIVERLQPEWDASRSPVFQTMFAWQQSPFTNERGLTAFALGEAGARVKVGGMTWESFALERRATQFDLTLTAAEVGGELAISLEYNTDLFDEATAERMGRHFVRVVEEVASSPARRVSEIELLSEREREELLFGLNRTRRDLAPGLFVHTTFEEQAARAPRALAVAHEGRELTYAELNARANQLARQLRARGVGPDVLVGVLLERSIELVIALLGVLKAGGAYVPLDPSYPRERVSFMLEDSAVPVLLTRRDLAEELSGLRCEVTSLDAQWEALCSRHSGENLPNVAAPDNLAYVIYTSGSTGRPKGVAVRHRSLVNFSLWYGELYALTGAARASLLASPAFDASASELWPYLCAGASLHLPDEQTRLSATSLARWLTRHEVTHCFAPTPLAELLLDEAWPPSSKLRLLFTGGDKLTKRPSPGLPFELVNLYGPAEYTVVTTSDVVRERGEGAPSIGRPVWNTRLYVLDEWGSPVPLGVAGELYVGGEGLARGYLGRARLTAEYFLPDTFGGEPGARMYRTGDLVRYAADGSLEFLGRLDQQVKLRGCRVELGEIEAALTAHPSVGECVVSVREGAEGNKLLVAYVVRASEAEGGVGVWREHLRSHLPEYMVPSAFVLMDALPLTPNGKVDRRALPDPVHDARASNADLRLARTHVEEVLAGLWAEVLRVGRVGLDDNFFELGGHSLLATQLMSRVREAFGVEVPLRELFEGPTVAALAARVERLLRRAEGASAPPLTRAERGGPLPLSFAQQRLWFVGKLEPDNPFYNVPAAVRLSGALDVSAWRRTLAEVVRRHEVLRTHFAEVEGEPVQVVAADANITVPLIDLGGLDEAGREAEAARLTAEEALTPFDLGVAPLIRAKLLRLSADEHVALLTMHHIVTDAWSIGVLVKEVAALYEAFTRGRPSPLAELELQYADFAAWQRRWLRGEVLEEQLNYWRRQLGGRLPVLELPTDRPRPAAQSFRGTHKTLTIRGDVVEGVRRLSRREGATLFMTLLAGFNALLHRHTGQDDILVGLAIAGRTRREVEPLIGFFVNTLVLRTDLSGNPRFRELLGRVREVTLAAYAHQDVPFEKLVEELQPERGLGHTPLVRVLFGVQNAPAGTLELPGLRLDIMDSPDEVGRFDLTVWVAETAEGAQVRWSYNTDLFEAATIERMHRRYVELLASAAAEPDARLSALNLLTTAEAEREAAERGQLEQASLKKLMSARRKPATLPHGRRPSY